MRFASLILMAAASAQFGEAQNTGSFGAGIAADFTISDAPCGFKHDPEVEKSFVVGAIRVPGTTPKQTGSNATVELRNRSAKAITAYVLTYTITRGKHTDYYGARGTDLIEQYGGKESVPNRAILPDQAYQAEIWAGRPGGRIEVYPCLVVFDDRLSAGPPQVLGSVMGMRQAELKFLGQLIAALEAARDSDDPKASLTRRASRSQKAPIETWREASGVRVKALSPLAGYLQAEASQLRGGNSVEDRRVITDRISVLGAQQKRLTEQSSSIPVR
jgi:hypothetical protein